jgi:N-acetylmuramoyl-L-alanine amidase
MKNINIKTFFLFCFLLTFFNTLIFGQIKDKVSKIVIDAGHGGGDPGTLSKLCKEKDLNLKIALQLGKLISANYDDVTVIFTRKKDETVELYKRAEIANKSKADLFISIHYNSADNKNAKGVETFVMGVGKTDESMAVAKKENAAILLEKDYQTNYSDFDPNSAEAFVVFSLYSSSYLKNSALFASKVQKHLVNSTKMTDREVKQAGYWVLYKVAMPSILVELGFISNPEEEKYLLREEIQELMAVSIYNAFVEYKNLVEGTQKPFLPLSNIAITEPKIENYDISNDINNSNAINISDLPNSETTNDTIAPPYPIQIEPVVNDLRFRIQFFLSKENLGITDKKFATLPEVRKYNENGVWKYIAGNFATLDEAQIKLKEIKKSYADAFIVVFNKEQKITIQEAQGIENSVP